MNERKYCFSFEPECFPLKYPKIENIYMNFFVCKKKKRKKRNYSLLRMLIDNYIFALFSLSSLPGFGSSQGELMRLIEYSTQKPRVFGLVHCKENNHGTALFAHHLFDAFLLPPWALSTRFVPRLQDRSFNAS